jgi:hypothetical protein
MTMRTTDTETKFGGYGCWKREMDRHELWPRMSKAMASRQLENRNDRTEEPIRNPETQTRPRQMERAFVPAPVRAAQKNQRAQ